MKKMRKVRGNSGYTLVELLIVMVIFLVVIGITTSVFNVLVGHSSRQIKEAEAQITGVVGLELLRSDLESAGFGLPWSFETPFAYAEVPGGDLLGMDSHPSDLNDGGATSALSFPPRAIVSGDGTNDGSDHLVIKSANVARQLTGGKYSYANFSTSGGVRIGTIRQWSGENLDPGVRVVILQTTYSPAAGYNQQLVYNNDLGLESYYYTLPNPATTLSPGFSPSSPSDKYLVYGIDTANLRMPFNRADYFIKKPADPDNPGQDFPKTCAPRTGILYKAVFSHDSNGYPADRQYPLLACVADMQVAYDLNGAISSTVPATVVSAGVPAAGADAAKNLRESLRSVRVYILTHEGGYDKNFSYPSSSITLGPGGGTFDLSAIGPTYKNYRWKVYTINVTPRNISG